MATQQDELQRWEVTEPYLNLHCALGEGPYYEPATNTLRFVDIMKHRLHAVNLTEGPSSASTLQLDTPVSVTADIEGANPKDKLLIGAKYGMAILDRAAGTYEYLSRFASPDNHDLRGNDGAVDPHGRFWLGSMTDFGRGPFQPHGSLHLFTGPSSEKNNTTLKSSLSIPNSVGWSPDGKTMYFTHTAEGVVYGYDYSSSGPPATGTATKERIVYRHKGTGGPDGFRVDVEGNIWHAFYGEGKVLKIAPDATQEGGDGKVLGEIKLPTPNITCVEFVGKGLYITTAALNEGQDGTETEKEMGGAVFRVEDVGVEGLGHYDFKM